MDLQTAIISEFQTRVRAWRADPTTFVTDAWPHVTPDPWQREALSALAAPSARLSIRACHGPGKSALDAWSVFWFLSCFFPARVPCTAPTAHQLQDILWAELSKWHQSMAHNWMKQLFRVTSERVEFVPAPRESFAVARTARPEQPEALQGFHCENLLFVLDEASGIAEPIFEVAQGALSDENARVIMTANPTRTSGYFFNSHTKMRHKWSAMRVSHEDSPRVTDAYVDEVAEMYGRESNVFRVRVLGEFPTSDDNAVIPLEWAEAAVGRQVAQYGDICWGLDVARFGDDRTALVKRSANKVLESVQAYHGLDLMQVSGMIVAQYDATPEANKPTAILVDSIGLGAGVVDRLRELKLPVVGVNVGEQASANKRFMRYRDELWWRLREWLEAKDCVLPEDEALVAELSMPTYKLTSAGKIQVESKDDMKRRGVRSPDLADALMLTFGHRYQKTRRAYARAYSRQRKQQKRGSHGGLSGIV